jgi:hypothetical protein
MSTKYKKSIHFEHLDTESVFVDEKTGKEFQLLVDFLEHGDIVSLALDSSIDQDRFKIRALAFLGIIGEKDYRKLERKLRELDS